MSLSTTSAYGNVARSGARDVEAPWEAANWLSELSMHWLTPLMLKAWRNKDGSKLEPSDFGPTASRFSYDANRVRWAKALADEGEKKSRIPLFVRVYFRELLVGWMGGLITAGVQLFLVYGLFQSIAGFLSDPSQTRGWGVALCVLFFVCSVLMNFLFAFTWVSGVKLAIRAKSGFMSTAFEKASRLRHLDTGHLLNVLSNDADRLFDMSLFLIWNLVAPCHIAGVLVLLGILLGWPGVLVIPLVVAAIVFVRLNGIAIGKLRKKILPSTDLRVSAISELIQNAKIVKVYLFEEAWSDSCSQVREKEIAAMKRTARRANLNALSVQVLAVFSVFAALVTALSREVLSASQAFTVLSLVAQIWFPSHMISLGLPKISVARESMLRLRKLLSEPEFESDGVVRCVDSLHPKICLRDNVRMRHWDDDRFEICIPESLCFGVGIHFVAGVIGSGKSSLLKGLLGQLHVMQGVVEVSGSPAYAPQEAFIQNSSLRENILFGSPFDERRYREAIALACLEPDIRHFVDGDFSEIGEKGVNLSGGQRQRVSLARVLYSGLSVVLLDDPLSALDARVGRKVFENLTAHFKRQQMCVVFTNHQLQYTEGADNVVVLDEGKVVQCGSYEALAHNEEGPFFSMLSQYRADEADEEDDAPSEEMESASEENALKLSRAADETVFRLVREEKSDSSRIQSRVLLSYIRAAGPQFLVAFVGFLLYQGLRAFGDFWLALYVQEQLESLSFGAWSGIWAALCVVALLLFLVSELLLYNSTLSAAESLHNTSLSNVLKAPMSFFDTTPSGQILNRFTRDTDIVDLQLPFAFEQLLVYAGQSLAIFVAIAVVYPLLLATFPVIFIVFVLLASLYRAGSRQCRRVWGAEKSKMFSALQTFLAGIDTIRALGKEATYKDIVELRIDDMSSLAWTNVMLGRFLNLRLDLMVSLLVFLTAIIAVTTRTLGGAGEGALAVSYTLRLASAFQWALRNVVEVESHMTSVERLLEYADPEFPVEPTSGLAKQLPESWPSSGNISFEDVTVRYHADGPPVLDHISFVLPGSKSLGIVGRTGAGKSSLISCLLRLIPYSGIIRIDGVDIAEVPLHRVRQAISVIPQECVVFAASFRKNLDPAGRFLDADLAAALQEVGLEVPESFDEEVPDMSAGQRQLLAIARSILHNGQVLVSDESTSSVDTETDLMVTRALERYLRAASVTSIKIAHRLQTVISSDYILVLERGKVMEFGSPKHLLQTTGSFRQLVLQTGKDSSRKLVRLATRHHEVSKSIPTLDVEWDEGIQGDFEAYSVNI